MCPRPNPTSPVRIGTHQGPCDNAHPPKPNTSPASANDNPKTDKTHSDPQPLTARAHGGAQ